MISKYREEIKFFQFKDFIIVILVLLLLAIFNYSFDKEDQLKNMELEITNLNNEVNGKKFELNRATFEIESLRQKLKKDNQFKNIFN